jgi:ParB family chromosome partitioning protein
MIINVVPRGFMMEKKKKIKDGNNKETSGMIAISEIMTEGQSVRYEDDYDHIVELSNSILRIGLLQPIVVTKVNGKYQLVAGKHRLEACKRIKWKYIDAKVVENGSDYCLPAYAMIENVLRKQMTIEEEVKVVGLLNGKENKSISQICAITGKGIGWVQKRLMAAELPQKVQERLFCNDISIGIAEELARIKDESVQNQIMWQAIQCQLTVTQVRDLAKLYLETPSLQEAVQAGQSSLFEILSKEKPQRDCDACGTKRTYPELANIFVCRNGCDENLLDKNNIKEGKKDG